MSEVFIWKKTEKSRSKGEVWRESRHQMKGLWQPHKQYFKDDVKKKGWYSMCKWEQNAGVMVRGGYSDSH